MEQVHSPKNKTFASGLIERARNIMLNPNREWDLIALERPDTNRIIMGYVIPLAALAAVAALIGYGLIGPGLSGAHFYGLTWGIFYACRVLISALVSVYVTALVMDGLAPSFGSEKNFGRSLQLVAYSFTPVWVGGLLVIIPFLGFLASLIGLYGLYLMYIGIPKMKHTPEDKHLGYFVVSLVVTLLIFIVISWILMALFVNLFLGYHATTVY